MTQGEANAGGGRSEGKGRDLKAAIDDAWEKAKKTPNRPTTLRVAEIHVTGNNPIHEYRVVLEP